LNIRPCLSLLALSGAFREDCLSPTKCASILDDL
jgi:hypothetical protein